MKIALAAGHGGIDPGTGWFDPGCCNGKYMEHAIALDIIDEIVNLIKGKIPYIIPKCDYDTSKMTKEAIDKGCDYYLCIHINSNVNTAGNGVSTYWTTSLSKEFNQVLFKKLRTIFNQFSDGVIYASDGMVLGQKYFYYKNPHKVIYGFLECGFISNNNDLDKILNHQNEIAIQIVKTLEYFSGVNVLARETEIILNMQGEKRDVAIKNGIEYKMPIHLVVVRDRNMIDFRSIVDLLRPNAKIEYNPNIKQIKISYEE